MLCTLQAVCTLFLPIFVKKKGSNIMPRKFVMPDPADRSKNEPAVILSPTQVLGLYIRNRSVVLIRKLE